MAPDEKRYRSDALFFIYAPPLLGRRRKDGTLISKRKLPNPPYPNAEPWKCSVYYYWWEYLRRHEGYRRTCLSGGKGKYARLYEDFGDVHSCDDFWTWWRAHQNLFCEPTSRGIQECLLNRHSDEDELILSVPLEVRSVHLIRMFRRILQENDERIRKARAKSRARYPVCAKPSLAALHTSLTIWDIKQAHPKLKLYEIFDYAADSTTIAIDERVVIKLDEDDEPFVIHLARAEREAQKTGIEDVFLRQARNVVRRRKAQTVNRHIKTARAYIDNVALGKFPLK